MNKAKLKETILKQIEQPLIPDCVYSALEFGVVSDSEAIQTAQLQAAIDLVSSKGGGKLVLPAGRYRTGALQLRSQVELHLESRDTVLSFVSEDPQLHYPVVFSHWEATPCYNFSPLIYAYEETDIAVTGEGILDGGADQDHWWNWHHQVENAWSADKPDLQLEDRKALRRMNMEGVPVKKRVFGPGHYLRPNFVQPIRCERLLLQGFTLKNSPMWQLNPVMCKSLTVDGVTMSSHGANNDGCDPESCSGVHICNCRFDTGDDCISLKSGRDRDGRIANIPCEDVLIEQNEFADGHGGVALGSEMSGGIRRVLAMNNRFSSPNLTYALRLKTNARRGGKVEDIILADSVMEHVHGAAVHGTMLYEDGRNGSDLPVFRNITIENITAHGGDYGIFLEAFEEVPITGLVLKNIQIDGVNQLMRSMNWKDPVIEQVRINGKSFPRPGCVRILGVPREGCEVKASSQVCGGPSACTFRWQFAEEREKWKEGGEGGSFRIPEGAAFLRVTAADLAGNEETSISYRVLAQPGTQNGSEQAAKKDPARLRLMCRGMLDELDETPDELEITREQLADMMLPLADPGRLCREGCGTDHAEDFRENSSTGNIDASEECSSQEGSQALRIAVGNGFLALQSGSLLPEGHVTRQEMATVAMQACGVNYRNASSTMPVCQDAAHVSNNYGTNVARALYFGFMELESDGCFVPNRFITMGEAVQILNRVADFAGI
ncbi:MAG: glycoside hydrolase family 28 protein [Lachnospiraceae bacterium]|nr:glycoside hydrolase family 28 protein [Lachnospiraceae bacterium]